MKAIIRQRHYKNRNSVDLVNVYKPLKQIQTAEVLRMLWEKECNAWINEPEYKVCNNDYAKVEDDECVVGFMVVNLPEVEID